MFIIDLILKGSTTVESEMGVCYFPIFGQYTMIDSIVYVVNVTPIDTQGDMG